jgi:hypothetical protein
MSMPVGQTCTQMPQSTQSPLPAALWSSLLRARAARLAALGVVGDDQRVGVEHDALEAGVGAHVLAHLLAHEAGVAPGGEGIEEDPEGLPGPELPAQHRTSQRLDRREVADEGEAGPQRDQGPDGVLGRLARELAGTPGRGIQLHARDAVALEAFLHPHEDLGVDGLRAGIAAEQTPGHGGEQEQGEGRDDQQDGEIEDVLRPEHQAEDVELALDDVEQHGLAAVPFEPAQAVEDRLGEPHHGPAPGGEGAGDAAGIDLLVGLVERGLADGDHFRAGWLRPGGGLRHVSVG